MVLSYVYDCVSWDTPEELGNCFVDVLEKIFHMNFIEYVPWFMYIMISQLRDYSISVDQARYATSVVSTYLDNSIIKYNYKFHKITSPRDII